MQATRNPSTPPRIRFIAIFGDDGSVAFSGLLIREILGAVVDCWFEVVRDLELPLSLLSVRASSCSAWLERTFTASDAIFCA